MTVLHQARSSSAGARAGSIRRVARSSTSAPSPADRRRCSRPVRSGRSVEGVGVGPQPGQPLDRAPRTAGSDRPAPSGVVDEHLVERVEVGAHGGELLLDVLEAVGQPRPPAGRAVRLPDLALRLDLEQRGVQVGDGPAGTDHVLGLLAQPPTQPVAHRRRRAPRATPWWPWRRRGRRRCARRRSAGTRRAPRARRRACVELLDPGDDASSPASARSRRPPARSARPAPAASSRAGARGGAPRCRRRHACAGPRRTRACRWAGPGTRRARRRARGRRSARRDAARRARARRRASAARSSSASAGSRSGARAAGGRRTRTRPTARAPRAGRRRRRAGARASATSSLRSATTPCASTAGASSVIAPSSRREIADRQPASGATSSSRSPRPSAASRSASAVAARRWPGT